MSQVTIRGDEEAMSRIMCLKSERRNRGLTLWQLAYEVGIPTDTISTWESGHVFPRIENYNRLAEFFGWPKYCGSSKPVKESPKRQEVDAESGRLTLSLSSAVIEALSRLSSDQGVSIQGLAQDILQMYVMIEERLCAGQ